MANTWSRHRTDLNLEKRWRIFEITIMNKVITNKFPKISSKNILVLRHHQKYFLRDVFPISKILSIDLPFNQILLFIN